MRVIPLGTVSSRGACSSSRFALRIVEPRAQRFAEGVAVEIGQAPAAFEVGRQPLVEGCQQTGVAAIGQAELRAGRAQELDACLPFALAFAPWQHREPELAQAIDQHRRGRAVARRRDRASLDDEIGEAALLAGLDRALVALEAERASLMEVRGIQAVEGVGIERRRKLDQTVAVLEAQLGHDQPGFAEQQRVVVQARTATVRQLVTPRLARVHFRDAVWIGECEQVTELVMRAHLRRCVAFELKSPPPLFRGLVDQRQGAAIGGVDTTTAAKVVQCVQAIAQIFGAPSLAAQWITTIEQGGDITGQRALIAARTHQQVGDAWMGTEREQLLAMRRDARVAVERIERLQQGDRRALCRRWWRVEQPQGIGAPLLEFEHEAGEFAARDLRPRARLQALAFRPQPITPAFGDAASTAGALGRRRLRDGDGVESTHATAGIEAWFARESGVNDHAHARKGHARLGDIGREHDATPIARAQYPRLLLDRQLAVQQQHLGLDLVQHARALFEFVLAGQEAEQVAGVLHQGLLHRAFQLERQRLLRARREMRDRHRITAAGAGQARRVEEARELLAIERGRHHHKAQVFAQAGLHVDTEREAEVAVQMALMEFVEQNRADAFEHRVILEHAREDAFGDDFNARRRRYLRFEADAITDGCTDRLAE